MVSYFLRKYPGYTADTLLDEYAIRVFSLLNESLKLDALERMSDLTVSGFPYMKDNERQEIIRELEAQSKDDTEIVFERDEDASNKLKEIFNKG